MTIFEIIEILELMAIFEITVFLFVFSQLISKINLGERLSSFVRPL